MATVPLSGTNIRLLTGVPFNNDYKNTRWFDTKDQQTSYFLAKPTKYTANDHTFQRIEGRTYVRVNMSIDELWGVNYLMFQNTDYNSKWFYAFVTKLEYVQKNTTHVHFQIDVFQTWKFDMDFKPSFVSREHTPLWDPNGNPVVNTIDEGLDYGTEYETVYLEQIKPTDDILFLVIVAKEQMHVSPPQIVPTMNGMPQPLSYYIHPFYRDGNTPDLKVDGSTRSLSPILETLKGMMALENAVNNVVSLYITEYPARYITHDDFGIDLNGTQFEAVNISDNGGTGNVNINTVYVKNFPTYLSTTKVMGNKYDGFKTVDESKLMMYPYCVTYLDDFKGGRKLIKNEYINGDDLVVRMRGSLGTSNKVSYSVDDYLVEDYLNDGDKIAGSYEQSLISSSPNDISILSDYLSAYLQGNRNQIQNQINQANWNGSFGAIMGGTIGSAQSMHRVKGGSYGMNPVGAIASGMEVVNSMAQTHYEIQGLMAKKTDINNTPAEMVKMGGNSAFDFGNGYWGAWIIKKQIKPEYIAQLQNYFNVFGYKVNRVKLPNFHTRKYWNYVQTNGCTILANINNEDLVELKSLFDNGITLWHTDDIGNYALVNEVI